MTGSVSITKTLNGKIQERFIYWGVHDILDADDTAELTEEIIAIFTHWVEEKLLKVTVLNKEGKIECDCPCPNELCTSIVHPCIKPKEHYLQRDAAYIDLEKQIIDEMRQALKEMEGEK